MPRSYPVVDRASVDNFLRVYNRGGLHLLFDEKSRQAMKDFADVSLRSYVDDLIERAAKAKTAKDAPAPVAPKSSIILTDV